MDAYEAQAVENSLSSARECLHGLDELLDAGPREDLEDRAGWVAERQAVALEAIAHAAYVLAEERREDRRRRGKNSPAAAW